MPSNEGKDVKWLQVRLELVLWQRVASTAIMNNCSVSDLVRGVLEERFGVDGPVCQRKANVLNEVSNQGSTPSRSTKLMSGSARMNSEVTRKSERDRQMEESPLSTTSVPVNPSTIKDGSHE